MKLTISRVAAMAFAFAAPVTAHAACTAPVLGAADLVDGPAMHLSINPTNPPQQFVDEKGQLKGLNVDLAEELGKRMCLDVELIRMDFPAQIPAMNGGRTDGMNTGMFWTEERSKLMWTVPYSEQSISIVVKADDAATVASEDDLAGKAVGVEINSYQQNWLKKHNETLAAAGKPEMTIRGFQTASNVVAALRAGQIDQAALVDSVARDLVARGEVKEVLSGLGKARVTMAFRNKAVADAIVAAFNEMEADGSYKALFDKWNLTPLPAGEAVAIAGPGPQN